MSLAVKLLNFAAKSTGLSKAVSKRLITAKDFIKFGTNGKKLIKEELAAGIKYYVPKPGIKMPTHPVTVDVPNPILEISASSLGKNVLAKGELGNVSLRLEKAFAAEKPAVENLLRKVFPGADFSIRAKSSNSIYSKLHKAVSEEGAIIRTDADAHKIVKDSIGGRITLPNLTEKDFYDVIKNAKIDGVPLTERQKRMVIKLFRHPESLTPAQRKTAEAVALPVKSLLAERQSAPVFKRLMLGVMKDGLTRNLTTVEKLKQCGIDDALLAEIKKNPNIEPFRITKFNNYRGPQGVAYFSDAQVEQLRKYQLASGEKFDIINCDSIIELDKYNLGDLDKNIRSAIKKSGYTTAQMNFVTKDGHIGELQITGKGTQKVYHPEHDKYDATQGKNTLGPLYNEYKSVLAKLKRGLRKRYDQYFNDLYNSTRESTELFIKTPKPQLDKSLNPILSIENMIKIAKDTKAMEASKYADFKPHYVQSVNYAA